MHSLWRYSECQNRPRCGLIGGGGYGDGDSVWFVHLVIGGAPCEGKKRLEPQGDLVDGKHASCVGHDSHQMGRQASIQSPDTGGANKSIYARVSFVRFEKVLCEKKRRLTPPLPRSISRSESIRYTLALVLGVVLVVIVSGSLRGGT